jgi:hypothetical protein
MATKKSIGVLFGILVISAWILGSVMQAGAETLKCKSAATATKDERVSVGDEEGHILGVQIMDGLGFCENGEITRIRYHAVFDFMPEKGVQAIGYSTMTFEDGSTIVTRFQRLVDPFQSGVGAAKATAEIVKGTG